MIRVSVPAVRAAEHRYIIDVMIGEFLGLPYTLSEHAQEHVQICAGSKEGSIVVRNSFLTMPEAEWLETGSLPTLPLDTLDLATVPFPVDHECNSLPVIYGSRSDNGWIQRHEHEMEIGIDLFGAAFFFLTRYEEMVTPYRDAHDRFPAAASLAVRSGFERIPIVNAYAELLWAALRALWPHLQRPARQRRVFVSHDVDWPLVSYRVPAKGLMRAAAGDVVIRRAPLTAFRRLGAGFSGHGLQHRIDPGNTFAFIMRESDRRGLRSAFYFITENTSAVMDGTHSMEQPFVRSLLRDIHRRGHEIGLHPGYETYLHPERIASAADRLMNACIREGIQQETWGGRQHYLRWRVPETWRSWDNAGLDYDSTVGFAETVGFRTGTCYEYPVFDVINRSRLRLRERPLVAMEMTLFEAASRSYMAARDDAGLEILESLSQTVRAHDGDMTLLWHNSSLITARQKRLYREALDIVIA